MTNMRTGMGRICISIF